MKFKIIDLLNKIANGEEPKIKYDNHILKYNKNEEKFIDKDGLNSLYEIDFSELNDEVEIIEEPKKIEKLDVELLGQEDNWLRNPTTGIIKQDIELNPYIIDTIRKNTLEFQHRIKELIDEINNLKEE